jgi:hypothetical protein
VVLEPKSVSPSDRDMAKSVFERVFSTNESTSGSSTGGGSAAAPKVTQRIQK